MFFKCFLIICFKQKTLQNDLICTHDGYTQENDEFGKHGDIADLVGEDVLKPNKNKERAANMLLMLEKVKPSPACWLLYFFLVLTLKNSVNYLPKCVDRPFCLVTVGKL